MTDTNTPPTADLPAAYDPSVVERKWQARWDERGTNHTDLSGPRPYYTLMMFPYPSAEGLHVGNLFAFTGNDIHGRFQRMRGHTVFEPLGYDAFGIHSENYALKVGVHPTELIPRNIANFRRQLRRAGLMVDWRYELSTTDPGYYKWTQWLFLQLYRRGLAYKKKGAVNWCPFDKTVLANEQVINGHCERCGHLVEQRFLEQWFFRITDYAGRLLDNLDGLDWSDSTKMAQRNWIGRSDGAELSFRVQDLMEFAGSATASGGGISGEVTSTPVDISVFTTRADTIFGATFLVLAPEHPLVDQLATDEQRAVVNAYRAAAAKQDIVTRKVNKDKTGVFTGAYAVNPATGAPMQIWIADYVLMEYGTGAIMAVPGHDERDFEFARKFGLPIPRVVGTDVHDTAPPTDAAFTDNLTGVMVNSGQFNGLTVPEAKHAIVAWLAERGAGRPVVNYRLHDWCISRQRYWGPPIPIIYCDGCGPVPVPEEDLPVVLPPLEDFRPDDSGISPLARDEAWYRVPCPKCGAPARRETDVSDTFLDSSWYFLRYPSADRGDVAFDAGITQRWLPVNSYIGGNEHAVLHLLYSRFVTMVLHDAGLLAFEEPFTRFRAHGTIIREGAKMSKSRGNVVNPDEYVERWGADAFRTYLMFLGSVRGGRRLPRPEHLGRAALSGSGVGVGARSGARRGVRDGRHAQAAPDDSQGHGRHPVAELQHGDRGDDGVRERAPGARAPTARRGGGAAGAARGSVRAARRRGTLGNARPREQRVRRRMARLRRRPGHRGGRHRRRAGERAHAGHRTGAQGRRAGRGGRGGDGRPGDRKVRHRITAEGDPRAEPAAQSGVVGRAVTPTRRTRPSSRGARRRPRPGSPRGRCRAAGPRAAAGRRR